MNKEEYDRKYKLHQMWLNGQEGGERADLTDANLTDANLTDANMGGINLSRANLIGSDLRDVDLTCANLTCANLTGANLTGANLTGANLSGAIGTFATFRIGRHTANFAGGYGSIGCERHTYDGWLEYGKEIGKRNGYTSAEIARYIAVIRIVVEWLKEKESDE